MCQFCGHEPHEVIQQAHGRHHDRDAGIQIKMGQPPTDLSSAMQNVLAELIVAFAHTENRPENSKPGLLDEIRALYAFCRSLFDMLLASDSGQLP